MSKSYTVTFGAGTWDSWGLGMNYCHYGKTITLELLHWYIYVECYKKEE